FDSLSQRGDADTVTIPNSHLLFSGDYQRSGADLIVSDRDHRVVVPNYFHGEKRPTLVSPEGTPLDPKVVQALTGHVAYAQAAASFVAVSVANTGDITVATPVASIGIRGTAVILDISSTDGKVSVSVVDQQDGQVHAVQVFNTRGDLIGTVTSNGGSLTLTPT